MTAADKLWRVVLSQPRSMDFRDFERVMLRFGFVLKRTSGSHPTYVHPKVTRPMSVQPRNGEAKAYQIRQFLDIVEEFGLTLGDDR